MGASLNSSGRRRISEINVTPFVDVMLVLLVIFMVTAPLMQQGMNVNLPETNTQALRVKDSPLILSVDDEGQYFLGRKAVPGDELEKRLTALFESRGSTELFLRADRAAPYGIVVQAMAAARRAGSDKLGIVTEAER
ncbi:MAG: biopolymer transporter ExbD [Myxococcota bacterium]|nr:biopolymer transporter ExbD [Myxococcota bacterium]